MNGTEQKNVLLIGQKDVEEPTNGEDDEEAKNVEDDEEDDIEVDDAEEATNAYEELNLALNPFLSVPVLSPFQ